MSLRCTKIIYVIMGLWCNGMHAAGDAAQLGADLAAIAKRYERVGMTFVPSPPRQSRRLPGVSKQGAGRPASVTKMGEQLKLDLPALKAAHDLALEVVGAATRSELSRRRHKDVPVLNLHGISSSSSSSTTLPELVRPSTPLPELVAPKPKRPASALRRRPASTSTTYSSSSSSSSSSLSSIEKQAETSKSVECNPVIFTPNVLSPGVLRVVRATEIRPREVRKFMPSEMAGVSIDTDKYTHPGDPTQLGRDIAFFERRIEAQAAKIALRYPPIS